MYSAFRWACASSMPLKRGTSLPLADADRDTATHHFELAVATKVATHNAAFYGWSHAFLKRLEDDQRPRKMQRAVRAASQPAADSE